jgi:hypothetical protein
MGCEFSPPCNIILLLIRRSVNLSLAENALMHEEVVEFIKKNVSRQWTQDR